MKTLALILILVSSLIGCGGGGGSTDNCEEEYVMRIPPVTTNIVCLGDSTTYGIASDAPYSRSNSWCGKLSYPTGTSIVNLAQPSKDITQIYREQFVMIPQNTSVVYVMSGANDAYHNIPPTLFAQEYQSLVDTLLRRGIKVYCITALPTHDVNITVDVYNSLTMQMRGCNIINLNSVAQDSWYNLSNDSPDKLHPTLFGYGEIANYINSVKYGERNDKEAVLKRLAELETIES